PKAPAATPSAPTAASSASSATSSNAGTPQAASPSWTTPSPSPPPATPSSPALWAIRPNAPPASSRQFRGHNTKLPNYVLCPRNQCGSPFSIPLVVRDRDGDVAGRGVAGCVGAGHSERVDAAGAGACAVGAEADGHPPRHLEVAAIQELVAGHGGDRASGGDVAVARIGGARGDGHRDHLVVRRPERVRRCRDGGDDRTGAVDHRHRRAAAAARGEGIELILDGELHGGG